MMDYDIIPYNWNAGVFRIPPPYCNILTNKTIRSDCRTRMYDHAYASIS